MDYSQAVDYILSFADWERASAQAFAAANFDLRRVQSLLTRLGDRHLGRRTIHIAGSKGKGSVAPASIPVLTSTTSASA